MTKIIEINRFNWSGTASTDAVQAAVPALEAGEVLFLPDLRFEVETSEGLLFTPSILGSSKNASYDPLSGRLGGTTAAGADARMLGRFIHRFSESAASLVR